MTFDVSADAYGRFMGQYSEPLAALFVEWSGVRAGDRLLDVGCGTGALTALLGPAAVGVDPSESFVAAARARLPGIEVVRAGAEQLPFPDVSFDGALAQLVVHFMADPAAGLREMARVTRPGGTIAACVWDFAGGRGPLSAFWSVVRELDPGYPGEALLAGTREGHLAELMTEVELGDVRSSELTVVRHYAGFDDWWDPYTLGVGPAGAYVAALTEPERERLRARCAEAMPNGPFELSATAWCAAGMA